MSTARDHTGSIRYGRSNRYRMIRYGTLSSNRCAFSTRGESNVYSFIPSIYLCVGTIRCSIQNTVCWKVICSRFNSAIGQICDFYIWNATLPSCEIVNTFTSADRPISSGHSGYSHVSIIVVCIGCYFMQYSRII